jgi:hypothetical protein
LILVRVDDFPQTKGEPQHTLAAFREFHRTLTECIGGKRYLLGVIPGRCTVDDLLMLRRETDVTVGMHGTDHDEARLDLNGGNQFEPYLSVGQIAQSLYDHRMALEGAVGRPVKVYMPPRNVISHRTVATLPGVGFEWFTVGPETDTWARSHERAIPSEKPHGYGRTDELLAADSHVHLRQHRGDAVLALHWTWETNIGLDHMRRFFAEIPKELFADFDA